MDSLTALADPTRRQIVEMLGRGERASGEIAEQFDISAPAVSQHLKVLGRRALVSVPGRGAAARRVLDLCPEGSQMIDAWLAEVRRNLEPDGSMHWSRRCARREEDEESRK